MTAETTTCPERAFDQSLVAYPRGISADLIHYNILDRGGHFAAWEQPALHAKEIRDCFAKVR
jgi:hypothetical protein